MSIQNISSQPSPFHPQHAYTSHAMRLVNVFANQSTHRSISTGIPPEEDIIPFSSPLPSSSPPRIFSSSPTKSDYNYNHEAYQHNTDTSLTSSPEKSESSHRTTYSPASSNRENFQLAVSASGIMASVDCVGEDSRAITTSGNTCGQTIPPNVLDGTTALDDQMQSPFCSDEVLEPSFPPPMDIPYASSPVKTVTKDQALDDHLDPSPQAMVYNYKSSDLSVSGRLDDITGSTEDEPGVNADTGLEGEGEDAHTNVALESCSTIAPVDIEMSSQLREVIDQGPIDTFDTTQLEEQQTSPHPDAVSSTEKNLSGSGSDMSSDHPITQSSTHRKRSNSPPSDRFAAEPASKRQVR